MPGYAIAQIDVTDESRYRQYMERVPATIDQYGGRYIVRGGEVDVIDGELPFPRIVVIEFPSSKRASEWARSPEYADACSYKKGASEGVLLVIDGVPEPD